MARILITPAVYQHGRGPWRDVLDAAGFEVVIPPVDCTQLDPAAFVKLLDGIDGALASVERYDDGVFSRCQLRAVARVGVGYDAIDVPAATRHGVVVTITPGTNDQSVAEQAIALLTAVFRDTARRDREVRQGVWRRDCPRRLAGNTMGLVGLGRIGKAMVPRCQGLGLNLLACDPYADVRWAAAHQVRLVSLEQLLNQSDIVSLHLPCTAESTNLICQRTIQQMKSGAVLLNTARGGLVDEQALADALHQGHLFGAGLDVCQVEPLPANSPLRSCDNIVFAPHLGGIDQDALDAMGKLAAQCLVDLFQQRWPEPCVVNPAVKDRWVSGP